MEMGLEPGFPPDLWNLSEQQKPEALHQAFVDAGARIIGGCCGTAPKHVAAMREAIDNFNAGQRPTMELVTQTLGELVSPPAAKGATGSRGSRGRRRK